jgi:hypothetical protein
VNRRQFSQNSGLLRLCVLGLLRCVSVRRYDACHSHASRGQQVPFPSMSPANGLRPLAPPLLPGKGTHCPRPATPSVFDRRTPTTHPRSRERAGRCARGRRREAQGAWPRAQRASTIDSPRLFERSERSERSELSGGPGDRCSEPGHRTVPADCPVPGERPGACKRRGTQGSRPTGPTASVVRTGRPAPDFAAQAVERRTHRTRRTFADDRIGADTAPEPWTVLDCPWVPVLVKAGTIAARRARRRGCRPS